MTFRSRVLVRALFAALLLSLPAMVLVRDRVGEPYPGLYQPAFEGLPLRAPGFARQEPQLVVRDDAGATHSFSAAEVVAAPRVDRTLVVQGVRNLLRDEALVRAPATVTYLRDRFVGLGVVSPVSVQVVWFSTTRREGELDKARRGAVLRSYSVDLRP